MRVISGQARGTKLNTIDELTTRPTLDRVKEAIFNIIQSRIEDAIVLVDGRISIKVKLHCFLICL